MSSSFSTAMAFIGVKNGIFKIMQDRGELNIDEINWTWSKILRGMA